VSLNPIQRCGKQVEEMLITKEKISKKEAKKKVLEAFHNVEISPEEQRYRQYPFELSGGMLQRIVIAMAMVCDSRLLLADEPTTALDVTTQGQILNLMKEMQQKNHMSVIVVTHNFGVVAEICDRVSVMYAGEIVESGDVRTIFNEPCHPYTVALMESRPDPSKRGEKMITIPGVPPSLYSVGKGCPFAARCKKALERCFVEKPAEIHMENGHQVRCHLCQ
ncbi:MAG: ABC transporter ATP-binding protein, partial [Eubacteriales bacterium]|nr:ABC transporter ATP-binding protein [Eubacteriales bacterium]